MSLGDILAFKNKSDLLSSRKRTLDYSSQNETDGTLVTGFKVPSDYSLSNASVASDTTNYLTGSNATAFTPSSGSYSYLAKTQSNDFSSATNFELKVYIPDITVVNYIVFVLYNGGSKFAKYQHNISSNPYTYYNGWNTLNFPKSLMSLNGGFVEADFATTTKWEISFDAVDANTPTVTYDSLKVNKKERSNIIFMLDDGHTSALTIVKPILDAYGYKACICINASTIGTAGKLTVAQVQELYNAGWDVINHSYSHDTMSGLTYDQNIKTIQDMQAYLLSIGVTRGINDFFAYPTQYSSQAYVALKDLGFKVARDSVGAINFMNNPSDKLKLQSYSANKNTLLATAKTYFDFCRYAGGTMPFYVHDISANPTVIDWYTDRFSDFVDYVASSDVNVLNMTDWYNSLFR